MKFLVTLMIALSFLSVANAETVHVQTDNPVKISLESEASLAHSLRIVTSVLCTDGKGAGGFYVEVQGVQRLNDKTVSYGWELIVGQEMAGMALITHEDDGTVVNINCGHMNL